MPDFAAKSERALRSWVEMASDRGADSFYLRAFKESGVVELQVLLEIARTYKLIVPANRPELFSLAAAVQFSEADSWSPADGKYCGRSCHSMESVERAEQAGFDFVLLSPVFKTSTHPEAEPLGLKVLAEVCRRVSIPVFALGGVTLVNEPECLQAGAAGIAAISMFVE